MIAEERPRLALTQSFSKLFKDLGLSSRAVSTAFGSRVNLAICLQVGFIQTNSHEFMLLIFTFANSTHSCVSDACFSLQCLILNSFSHSQVNFSLLLLKEMFFQGNFKDY